MLWPVALGGVGPHGPGPGAGLGGVAFGLGFEARRGEVVEDAIWEEEVVRGADGGESIAPAALARKEGDGVACVCVDPLEGLRG